MALLAVCAFMIGAVLMICGILLMIDEPSCVLVALFGAIIVVCGTSAWHSATTDVHHLRDKAVAAGLAVWDTDTLEQRITILGPGNCRILIGGAKVMRGTSYFVVDDGTDNPRFFDAKHVTC